MATLYVGGRLFAVPLSAVVEITRIQDQEIHKVDQREVLRLRDQILTLVRLNQLNRIHPVETQGAKKTKILYSCNIVDFAEVAGGHNFRAERSSRIKYRYYHHLRGFVERYRANREKPRNDFEGNSITHFSVRNNCSWRRDNARNGYCNSPS